MKFVIVWGENSKLRGENFPPKGPEKNTGYHYYAPPSQVGRRWSEIRDLNRAIIQFPYTGATSFIKYVLYKCTHVQ